MYCMKCKTQLPEDVVFCATCETPPGSTATGTQQQQGQWEYQEVTIPFDPPFMVEMDASGIAYCAAMLSFVVAHISHPSTLLLTRQAHTAAPSY